MSTHTEKLDLLNYNQIKKGLELAKNWDLINELQNRGYKTELLYSREDVEMQLSDIIEDRDLQISLTDEEKDEILESICFEYYMESINEKIYEKLSDYIEDYIEELREADSDTYTKWG